MRLMKRKGVPWQRSYPQTSNHGSLNTFEIRFKKNEKERPMTAPTIFEIFSDYV
jgi:hypothetical protein